MFLFARKHDMLPIYQRIRDEGRMFPEGLKYIDSWVEPNFSRCSQLMECDDLRLLQEWILNVVLGQLLKLFLWLAARKHEKSSIPYLTSKPRSLNQKPGGGSKEPDISVMRSAIASNCISRHR
jgi:Protein of unknown function (DUF3303)